MVLLATCYIIVFKVGVVCIPQVSCHSLILVAMVTDSLDQMMDIEQFTCLLL